MKKANKDHDDLRRMPALDLIHERFIRLFRETLSNSLQRVATLSVKDTQVLKFSEYVDPLPIPLMTGILRFKDPAGPAFLAVETELAYALVDSYLGGTDRPYRMPQGKEFTKIERALLQRVIHEAANDLGEAWSLVHETSISAVGIEVIPHFVPGITPGEVVLRTQFEVELEGASGNMTLLLPKSALEPRRSELRRSSSAAKAQATRPVSGELPSAPEKMKGQELKTELERTKKRLNEALALCDARSLAGYLVSEHPQTISTVLSFAQPEKRGEVLMRLPEEIQTEIFLRIADLEHIHPRIFVLLADTFVFHLESLVGVFERHEIGGVKAVADTLGVMDEKTRASMMDRMAEKDPQLVEEIRKLSKKNSRNTNEVGNRGGSQAA